MNSHESHPLWADFVEWESLHDHARSERFRLWLAFLAGAAAEEKNRDDGEGEEG